MPATLLARGDQAGKDLGIRRINLKAATDKERQEGGLLLRLNPAELNPCSERPPSAAKRRRVMGVHHRALHHNENCDTNARVQQVKEEIFSIDKVDVAVIRISPTYGPCIDDLKTVAAVLKLRPAFYDYGFRGKGMAPAKAGTELL